MDAALVLDVARIYAMVGVGVAVLFLIIGIGRVVPAAAGAWTMRPLLAPGIVLLWPLVLWRWWQLERRAPAAGVERPPRRAQDRVALVMAILLPVVLAVSLAVRQDGPAERPAVQIAPPPAAGPGDTGSEAAGGAGGTDP